MKGGESVSMRARVYTCSLRADTRVCRMWWWGGPGRGRETARGVVGGPAGGGGKAERQRCVCVVFGSVA